MKLLNNLLTLFTHISYLFLISLLPNNIIKLLLGILYIIFIIINYNYKIKFVTTYYVDREYYNKLYMLYEFYRDNKNDYNFDEKLNQNFYESEINELKKIYQDKYLK